MSGRVFPLPPGVPGHSVRGDDLLRSALLCVTQTEGGIDCGLNCAPCVVFAALTSGRPQKQGLQIQYRGYNTEVSLAVRAVTGAALAAARTDPKGPFPQPRSQPLPAPSSLRLSL